MPELPGVVPFGGSVRLTRSQQVAWRALRFLGQTILSVFVLWILLILFLSLPARGQGLVEAPKPKVKGKVADDKFWLALGVLGAAKAADAVTTQRMLGRGCWERNPWLGPHPGGGRLAASAGAQFAGEVVTAYLLKKALRRHKWLGRVWIIEPTWQAGEHARNAWRNERLVCP